MYTPTNPCTSLLHLLLRFPILTIGLGIVTAVTLMQDKTPDQIEDLLVQIDTSSVDKSLVDSAFNVFTRIVKVESGIELQTDSSSDPFEIFSKISTKEKNSGKHLDGVSYGPAGLTEIALRSILRNKNTNVNYILNSPSLSTSYAYIYFLSLIHNYKDMKYAVIAYNFGITRVSKYLKENKELPQEYYNKVMKQKTLRKDKNEI